MSLYEALFIFGEKECLDPCLLAASVTMTTKRLLYAISLTCGPLWVFKDFATLINPVSCCLIIQIKLEKGGAEALDDALQE